jgi:hypothetical protein
MGCGPNGLYGLRRSLEDFRSSVNRPHGMPFHLEPFLWTISPWSLTCVPTECSPPNFGAYMFYCRFIVRDNSHIMYCFPTLPLIYVED